MVWTSSEVLEMYPTLYCVFLPSSKIPICLPLWIAEGLQAISHISRGETETLYFFPLLPKLSTIVILANEWSSLFWSITYTKNLHEYYSSRDIRTGCPNDASETGLTTFAVNLVLAIQAATSYYYCGRS